MFHQGVSHELAGFLADVCCYQGALPIGAPTSPCIANLVLRSFDKAMTTAARKIGAKYTRYADDLTISGSEDCLKLISFAKYLLEKEGIFPQRKKDQRLSPPAGAKSLPDSR